MTAKKKRTARAGDPFDRACTACGAAKNTPCDTRGKDSIPLVSRATRLVHAVRLKGDE